MHNPTITLLRPEEDSNENYVKEFEKAAKSSYNMMTKQYDSEVLWSYSDGTNDIHNAFMKKMQLTDADLPVLKAVDTRGASPIEYELVEGDKSRWNADTFKKFAADVIAGTASRDLASEKIPEVNEGPVLKVVGKQFDDLITNSAKDVALLVYSPNCGHCKAMLPHWEELGELYKGSSDTVIAKIDATNNYYGDDIKVTGYPTMVFISKDGGEPKKYDSNERTARDFKNWIEGVRNEKKAEL